jgi:hypothetical protein
MVSQKYLCCCLIKGEKNQTKPNQTKQNNTKQNKTKKTPQSVPSSNAIEFQYVFQHAGVVQLLSHQRKNLETVL